MSYQTAYRRWVGIGPYYAMFPTSFVENTIKKYTQPGDWIFDPFAGRASVFLLAQLLNRPAIGIKLILSVGCTVKQKLHRPQKKWFWLGLNKSLNIDRFSLKSPMIFKIFLISAFLNKL